MKRLCDILENALEYSDIEIPSYINSNLNKELREYQLKALKHFLLQRKNPKTNHLMFNMATGSGKTLIMAALMLECYKNGYRNFIFFVNSTTILEKTKSNFTSIYSNKYLFKEQIFIDSNPININLINNLEESREDSINIHFTTIQMLFSLLTIDRENSPTLDDFKNKKVVFLADEAHHLNADTKNKQKKEDKELKEGWETIINKAFESNKENLILEFSATIPRDLAVLEKYKSKIVYEYDLKKFCLDGYSKRIFVLKYESFELKDRLLGGILMSLFRELIAFENGLFIKPVVLFKSENIASSLANENIFLEFLENLNEEDIRKFYSFINENENELFYKSLKFFKNKFGDSYTYALKNSLKNNFKKIFILNTNSTEDASKHQLLLNSLEDKENEIRVIFCVDKLNEGWDVLNLFDIVRLGNKQVNKTTTTKEVQLIGRGARYYPFNSATPMHLKYKRKFDCNATNPLSILEYLSYHTINDARFIKDLNENMLREGLLTNEEYEKIDLTPTIYANEITKNNAIYYAKNNRYKKSELESYCMESNEIQKEIIELKIPLHSRGIEEIEQDFNNYKEEIEMRSIGRSSKIPMHFFLKAMNMENLEFSEIKKYHSCNSKKEFIENYLGSIPISFHFKQSFENANDCLSLAKYIISKVKNVREKIKQEYTITPFEVHKFENFDRAIFAKKNKIKKLNYEWLFYDKCLFDSKLEAEFLDFIESNKEIINEYFKEWFIVRNDGFEEFKIYDNREKEASYAKGFEPDFIFFGRKEGGDFIGIQCFIEVKGKHLAGDAEIKGVDKWKEEFLASIKGYKLSLHNSLKNNNFLKIESLPFFVSINDSKFIESFLKFLES